MSKSSVSVRPATSADLAALVEFGGQMRDQLLPVPDGATRRGVATPAVQDALRARYVEALADPDRHLVVAVTEDGQTLGMALFAVAVANALLDRVCLHVNHLVVPDRHRRRGAGKALVAAAAAFAEERGLEQVVVSVSPGSRESNRFFARLGFAPLVVRRVALVSVLRRRLATPAPPPVDHTVVPGPRRPRRPRRLRGRAPLPLGAAEPEPAGADD